MGIVDKLHKKKELNPGSKVTHKKAKKELVGDRKYCPGCADMVDYDKFRHLADGRRAIYCLECEDWYIRKKMNVSDPTDGVPNIMTRSPKETYYAMGNNKEFKVW